MSENEQISRFARWTQIEFLDISNPCDKNASEQFDFAQCFIMDIEEATRGRSTEASTGWFFGWDLTYIEWIF